MGMGARRDDAVTRIIGIRSRFVFIVARTYNFRNAICSVYLYTYVGQPLVYERGTVHAICMHRVYCVRSSTQLYTYELVDLK